MPHLIRQIRTFVWLAVLFLAIGISLAAQNPTPPNADKVRERYTKYEFLVPMRDGVRLFTSIYAPKDTSQKYPFLPHAPRPTASRLMA